MYFVVFEFGNYPEWCYIPYNKSNFYRITKEVFGSAGSRSEWGMKVNPLIVFRKEWEGWGLLFNPDNGESFGMNSTSTFIWERLEEGKNLTEILAALREVSELPDSAEQEIAAFLDELKAKGYIAEE